MHTVRLLLLIGNQDYESKQQTEQTLIRLNEQSYLGLYCLSKPLL